MLESGLKLLQQPFTSSPLSTTNTRNVNHRALPPPSLLETHVLTVAIVSSSMQLMIVLLSPKLKIGNKSYASQGDALFVFEEDTSAGSAGRESSVVTVVASTMLLSVAVSPKQVEHKTLQLFQSQAHQPELMHPHLQFSTPMLLPSKCLAATLPRSMLELTGPHSFRQLKYSCITHSRLI